MLIQEFEYNTIKRYGNLSTRIKPKNVKQWKQELEQKIKKKVTMIERPEANTSYMTKSGNTKKFDTVGYLVEIMEENK